MSHEVRTDASFPDTRSRHAHKMLPDNRDGTRSAREPRTFPRICKGSCIRLDYEEKNLLLVLCIRNSVQDLTSHGFPVTDDCIIKNSKLLPGPTLSKCRRTESILESQHFLPVVLTLARTTFAAVAFRTFTLITTHGVDASSSAVAEIVLKTFIDVDAEAS